MRINLWSALVLLGLSWPSISFAADTQDDPTIFHYSRLETDVGDDRDEFATRWNLDAWLGGDTDKIWVKSEGDVKGNTTVKAEFLGLYSHNVADFWDVQAGIRQDAEPSATTYFTFGVNGLAPYYFETEAYVFISDRGDLSTRIKESNDLLITQCLITQPYAELNLYAQNDIQRYIGSGVAGDVGLQTRYEITRQFAPYIDLRYEDKFGQAATQAIRTGDDARGFIASVGLRLMY
ncbi:MAG: copper resistance protein B [Alphaproteobacteria bacterium]